jgi:hypothetical protein
VSKELIADKELTGMDRDCQDKRKTKGKEQKVKVKEGMMIDAVSFFAFILFILSIPV